ncbi:MAG TPA: T9SS type A sorting domain-containing protein [Brumimicrobium sp.]|nr:T9SS type A sorting domain-containing protein [Brumimicrobium sp.]
MKKITLAFALLAFGVQAQNFPSPYCDIDGTSTTTEQIYLVKFAEMSIPNTDSLSILVDKTSSVVTVLKGETYTITVAGNTKGYFDNDIVAFIDWNQNDVLDDTDEVYEIGTIVNSDTSGGVAVSFNITIPTDALNGETRIRITKTYTDDDSPALINPCAIEFDAFGQGAFAGYGQALDFTLNVGTLGLNDFKTSGLSVYPVPAHDVLNIDYKSKLNKAKVYDNLGKEVYSQNIDSSEAQLDLSALNPGVYIVRLFSDQGQHSLRIVKQ